MVDLGAVAAAVLLYSSQLLLWACSPRAEFRNPCPWPFLFQISSALVPAKHWLKSSRSQTGEGKISLSWAIPGVGESSGRLPGIRCSFSLDLHGVWTSSKAQQELQHWSRYYMQPTTVDWVTCQTTEFCLYLVSDRLLQMASDRSVRPHGWLPILSHT